MHTTGGGPPPVAFGRCNKGLQATQQRSSHVCHNRSCRQDRETTTTTTTQREE